MSAATARWRLAWLALGVALAFHVLDEALTGFLPLYNSSVADLRARHAWLPLPAFTFPVWIGGLAAGILLLFACTPLVSRGRRGMRIVSIVLGVLMCGNALLHLAASVAWGRVAPGALSSPLLLVAAAALVVTAARATDRRGSLDGISPRSR